MSSSDVTLAILAGGKGSRMGRPKGLLRIQGRPILGYLLEQIEWPGPTWLVTAPGREHPPGWERFDREITDPVAGAGPLRGVLTALERLQTSLLVVATVDMPAMRRENFEWLISQIQSSSVVGLMCRRTTGDDDVVEPFPLVLRKQGQVTVRDQFEGGQLSVQRLCDDPTFTAITAPANWNERVWMNLNRPSDLKDFEGEVART